MDKDELVERVAEALWREDFRRGAGRERITPWAEAGDHPHMQWRSLARAALAIIEPCVRADAAEQAALGCEGSAAQFDAIAQNDAERIFATTLRMQAAAIRAGAKP